MKGKIISRILIVLLAAVMVLPLFATATSVDASAEIDTTYRDRIEHVIINQGRTPAEQDDYNSLKWQLSIESDISYIRNYVEEQEIYLQKHPVPHSAGRASGVSNGRLRQRGAADRRLRRLRFPTL